ncbi:FAD/NAD P-binding domain-containing protein [Gloeophyllum trabeum ATCC 11539]|uniref:FAD/NAD P-binding domain-containing protein n=1 Tax=Gloeophyllum trabeum (strain ATCC 11539 / FP-39264 / Madison 617) TaxID=670483 RepID=S7Q9I2_GLOTA|nr:FAD/NAD P-binding domain-containing protein [Gloeophyllum trabeum ATCC 11539]EPQ56177.1 FAD/NAD P-binding domain-containing protein [Gloeophyllum trabeum ATCC 11539]
MSDGKTPLPLSFIVIGGSIAGLACAYSLHRAGHEVTVIEKASGPECRRGAIRSPPNMTRILKEWGLQSSLEQMGIKNARINFRQCDTGEKIGTIIFHDQIMKAFRADYLFLEYGRLWSLLHGLVTEAGVNIRFKSLATAVDPQKPTVSIANGESLTCDIVVGADGYESVARRCILGGQTRGTVDKRCNFTLTVPTRVMKTDADLKYFAEAPEWNAWLGNGSCIHGHLGSNDWYTLYLVIPSDAPPDFRENWDGECSLDQLKLDLGQYDKRLHKLMQMAETVVPVKFVSHEPFESLVHESGKVLVVGDAAHPIPPHRDLNTSSAVEDAMTFGSMFSRLTDRDQIGSLVTAFEDIRQPRSVKVVKSEHHRLDFLSLPFGPEQKARDDGLRAALELAQLDWDSADEDYLRETWEDYIAMFNYDAREVVDDWWTKWGPVMRRASVSQKQT